MCIRELAVNKLFLLVLLVTPSIALASNSVVVPYWIAAVVVFAVLMFFVLGYYFLSRLPNSSTPDAVICHYCRSIKDSTNALCAKCHSHLL